METECAHVFVTGYVQGVFFRSSMAQRARAAGLSGWVRNLPDGRVEAVIQGERDAVAALVAWCKHGPAHATVESIDVSWEAVSAAISGFRTL